MTWKSRLWLAARVVITIALLAAVFRDTGLRKSLSSLPAPSAPGWLGAAWIAAGICELAGIVRLAFCLRLSGVAMPLGKVALLHFAGLFASLFLPGTAGGDALKLALIVLHFPSRKMAVVLGLMLDRLSGFIVIVAWTAVAAWLKEDWFAQSATAVTTLRATLAIAGPLAGSLVLWFCMSRTGWMRTRMPDFPLRARLLKCEEVFDRIAAQRTVSAGIFAASAIAFAAHFYTFHATAVAFGGDARVGDTFAAMPLIDMVTMLPVTIAGIGLREHAFVQLYAPLCGLTNEQAVVTSIGGFLISSAWALPGAMAFLYIRPAMKKAAGDV